ncbi:MAG: EscU/YscU/HrcU family type III secretion system export apparatus switch protein [Anaerolineaceae bacterium]|nr:EscU/YscU/HrcU family type III secretion system export apparatus switch protein [Anaerolineaceae bacterium]
MTYHRLKVANPSEKKSGGPTTAAALAYDPGSDSAPRVVASGQGHIAEQIIALAKANNIPVYDDPGLTAALSTVDLGQEIPPELYLVVAEVLAYIYRVAHNRKPCG